MRESVLYIKKSEKVITKIQSYRKISFQCKKVAKFRGARSPRIKKIWKMKGYAGFCAVGKPIRYTNLRMFYYALYIYIYINIYFYVSYL